MTSLRMLQLVSPALPVGAFSYSEGLEWLIQNAKISDEFMLFNWLQSNVCWRAKGRLDWRHWIFL